MIGTPFEAGIFRRALLRNVSVVCPARSFSGLVDHADLAACLHGRVVVGWIVVREIDHHWIDWMGHSFLLVGFGKQSRASCSSNGPIGYSLSLSSVRHRRCRPQWTKPSGMFDGETITGFVSYCGIPAA